MLNLKRSFLKTINKAFGSLLIPVLQLNVVGMSFHVGCRASDATAYAKEISHSHQVFNIVKSEFNYEFQILNIGGMI